MFDALSFLQDNGISISTRSKNVQSGWVGVSCPLCGDTSDHGGFNLAQGYYYCWKCGWHPLKEVVSTLLNSSDEETDEIIDSYSTRMVLLDNLKNEKVPLAESITMPGEELGKFHRKYLKTRGFDPDYLAEKYKLKGTGPSGSFKLRIMIPIYFKGELVSYTGRDITGKQEIRYKTLSVENSVMNPKHVLFNIDNCKNDWIGVVEGPMDVFRMGDDFCAGLGTTFTDYQIKLLTAYKKVVFLFDSEKEAQQRAEKYAVQLSSLGVKNIWIVDFELTKDPGEYSDRMAKRVRSKIKGLIHEGS